VRRGLRELVLERKGVVGREERDGRLVAGRPPGIAREPRERAQDVGARPVDAAERRRGKNPSGCYFQADYGESSCSDCCESLYSLVSRHELASEVGGEGLGALQV
jgi:hypothetical protein